jgi:hypothetical protein
MATYIAQLSVPTNGRQKFDGLIVQANSDTQAREVCASMKDDVSWLTANLCDLTNNGFGDGLRGYRYHLVVERKAGDPQAGNLIDIVVKGLSGWGLEEMGTALKNALRATRLALGADFTIGDPGGSNNILKVADADDGLGDRKISMRVYGGPANNWDIEMSGFVDNGTRGASPIVSMVGAIIDGGLTAADLSVALTYSTSNYPQIGFLI